MPEQEIDRDAEALKRRDSDRYLTALFAPAARRPALFALYNFNAEIARVRDSVSEPMMGAIRLQWWRDAVAAAFEGRDLARPLQPKLRAAIEIYGLPRDPFEVLIAARESDLERSSVPTDEAALIEYAEASSASLLDLALVVLEEPDWEFAQPLGIAWGLIGLMRALPFHARQRRLYLPQTVMAAVGLDPADVLELRRPTQLPEAVRAVLGLAGEYLRDAESQRRRLPRATLPVALLGTLARFYLGQFERVGFDPYRPEIAAAPPGRIWKLGWRYCLGRF